MKQGMRQGRGRRESKKEGGSREGKEGKKGGRGVHISTPGLKTSTTATSHLVSMSMYVPVVFSVSLLLCSGCVGSCRSTAGILLV